MTREQLVALLDYLDARMDEKIADAFGRDGQSETLIRMAYWKDLVAAFPLLELKKK